MPDLKAKLRAKFRRRHSASVGDLAKESSTLSTASSSIIDGRSSLVSRSSTTGSNSQGLEQRPAESSTATQSENENTNHIAPSNQGHLTTSASWGSVKTSTSPTPTTNKHDKSWNVADGEDEDEDVIDDPKARNNTSSGKQAIGTSAGSATPASASATATASIPDEIQASDMNGSDLRPSISRLPSINEQPLSETSDSNGVEAAAATSAHESANTTDDDDGITATTPYTVPEPQTTKVVPATPDPTHTLRPRPVSRPSGPPRRQSLLPNRQSTLIQALLSTAAQGDANDFSGAEQLIPFHNSMVTRKIWVKRQGSSATQVVINEDDLVDDVRDMILRKYGNSLGRQFDSPDITLRIVPREKRLERTLGPEEPMCRTLDAYFPGGQTVDEALIIDVPSVRRTPRASPRTGPPHASHLTSVVGYYDELRPTDSSTDYFGPSVITGVHVPMTVTAPSTGSSHPHSMSILNTGQVPQIPSPGGTRSRNYRDRPDRPRLGRQHTSSPTIIGGHPVIMSGVTVNHGMHDQSTGVPPPPAPPMPTPPAGDMPNSVPSMIPIQRTATPPPRTSSPRPAVPTDGRPPKPKKKKTTDQAPPALPQSILNNGIPPINVLIVEDNIINLKLLEAFVKRLKVRWQTAMNGRDAITKWRTGGFHLVLMDIQLPILNGLLATKEIRRLERANGIGVFSGSAGKALAEQDQTAAPEEADRLKNKELFKSPVIIVALTASSLQSDREEALAAGCNDFLTKPVNFVWLERKVMEWGCMQALIDYDGWRQWKDFSHKADEAEASKKTVAKAKKSKNRTSSATSSAPAAAAEA